MPPNAATVTRTNTAIAATTTRVSAPRADIRLLSSKQSPVHPCTRERGSQGFVRDGL
jgi:pSer/pThr/pTyr-binding forkhead associated (FHA) protein